MTTSPSDEAGAQRPTAAALAALPTDAWAELLAVALPVLRSLPDLLVDATVRRLAAAPPARLVGGRSRRDLTAVLTRPAIWTAVVAAWPDDRSRPWEADAAGPDPQVVALQADVARLEQQLAELRERDARRSDRLAELRGERDAARREAEGARVRATAAEEAVATAEQARAALEAELEEATAALAAASDERRRAVERATRREDAADRRLAERLTAVRRERDQLRVRVEAAEARAERAEELAAAAPDPASAPPRPVTGRGRRGRPSTLPDGVVAGTKEAAAWLVGDGRALLVDGYNVTRTHRQDLDLPAQRRWLEQGVAALARRRHVDATVVWDSTVGAPSTARPAPGITVRFTEPELSADDELVLHVRTLLEPDEPVVVVTDDRELRERLRADGVDLLDTRSFTWLL